MEINFEIELIGQIDDTKDDSIDVFIRFKNGEEYVATFFTIKSIERIISKNRVSGEQLGGQYFWASDMIIVEQITEGIIREAIEDLIKTHGFYLAVSATNDLSKSRVLKETKSQAFGEALTNPIHLRTKRI